MVHITRRIIKILTILFHLARTLPRVVAVHRDRGLPGYLEQSTFHTSFSFLPAPSSSSRHRSGHPCSSVEWERVASTAVPGNFDINAVDRRRGETALQIAVSENASESIKLILSQDVVQADMAELLHRARFHLTIEAILAHGGVDIDHPDQYGRSALSNAAYDNDRKRALVLLKYSARPDLRDEDGYTPISRAAAVKQADMVELLEWAIGII
ncbi:ankyrin repeat-containing domain protein [Aspergillus spectabilis]